MASLKQARQKKAFDRSKAREVGAIDSPATHARSLAAEPQPKPKPAGISALPMPTPSLSFDGLSNYDNIAAYGAVILPPDMTGDVGPNHYVQVVNALMRIFDKNGSALTPPFRMSQIFAPLGTVCSARDDGEAVVLYDPLADRWLLSQYCNAFPPFRQMIAVSKTGDPTGSYFLYEFVMPNNRINDLSKFGVWPDGYYMSDEEFTGSDYSGEGMFSFDRAKMLVGDPSASYIYFNRASLSAARLGNILPSDLDGLRPPAAATPNVFVGYSATEYGEPQDAVRLFDFHVDFANPSLSTFTERPESPLSVTAFDPTSPDGRNDIAQPAPGEFLDSNSDRLMYRAAYRNLGASESIVVNQTVRLQPTPYRAGVRLYELKRAGGAFSVTEESTIGNQASSRWIGSAAEDNQGNMAVAYNYVNDAKQPAIFYTGRLAGESPGTFREETALVDGTGVQKAFGWRWGDYSSMSVDPVDDCTFWTTGEYYTIDGQNFSDFTWQTRIGKFKFAECTAAPRSVITGRVTNASNGQPIANSLVSAATYSRLTPASGSYGEMAVVPGSYTVTASARGFQPQSFVVSAANGQTITQDFALTPVPVIEVTATQLSQEACPNGVPEPGEFVTLQISLRNTGTVPSQDLVAALLETGGVLIAPPPQDYGPMPPNGQPVTRGFLFRISPVVPCGDKVTMTLHLTDGSVDLGNVIIDLQTGRQKIALSQDFDRTQQGGVPQRWVRSSSTASSILVPRDWSVSAARSQSGPKSMFSPDPNQVGENELRTPVFLVGTANARLSFHHWYDLETTFLRNRLYDGSVLEIRMGEGPWQDILAAGGSFESGGYDGTIDSCCQNPLAGRSGWSGRSGIDQTPQWVAASVRLPASAAGQFVQLRFRVGTDIGGFREGEYLDDVTVTDGYVCACFIP